MFARNRLRSQEIVYSKSAQELAIPGESLVRDQKAASWMCVESRWGRCWILS